MTIRPSANRRTALTRENERSAESCEAARSMSGGPNVRAGRPARDSAETMVTPELSELTVATELPLGLSLTQPDAIVTDTVRIANEFEVHSRYRQRLVRGAIVKLRTWRISSCIDLLILLSTGRYRWDPVETYETYQWQGDPWRVRVSETSGQAWAMNLR